jgi:hypothetical protein
MTPVDYVDIALQLIRTHASANDQGITAAHLGALLHRSVPNCDWRNLGYTTLKQFLMTMEADDLVQLGETTKGALSVSPKNKTFALEPTGTPPKSRTFNPLRKPFWVAFVVYEPRGRRFFHRPSGNIRMGAREAPAPRDEWIEIPPIPDETQREWAEEFLKKQSLRNREEFAQILDDPEWVKKLPKELAGIEPGLAKEWNRQRSVRVSEAVQVWSSTNGIDPSIAFQSGPRAPKTTDSRLVQAKGVAGTPKSARARVLSALALLPTEYLLEIPIPAKYLLPPDAPAGNGF